MSHDPVCLMEVDPREAAAMAEHEGRMYYFCSDRCKERFVDQPSQFTDKAPGPRLTVGAMGSADDDASAHAKQLAHALGRAVTNIHSSDMVVILGRLEETYTSEHYKRPSCFCDDFRASEIGEISGNEHE